MRWGFAGAAALLLSGCISFLPSFDKSVYDKLDAAVTDIEKVRAAVDVPYAPKPNFKEVEPLYISALGNLIAAERLADQRTLSIVAKQPSRESAGLLARAIGDCRRAVEALANRHQAGEPVTGFIIDNSLVARNCKIPLMMEKRLER